MSPAPPRRLAVIDIGTNSIKLLVADVEGGRVTPFAFRRTTTRIGKGLYRSGRIRTDMLKTSIDVIARFTRVARRSGASQTFAFSTYALRTATNAGAVLSRIERDAGVNVRVLSGREEARYACLSARSKLSRPRPGTLTFDIGGGSCEVVLAESGRVVDAASLPLGALVLSERFISTDPIDPAEYLRLCRHVEGRLSSWFSKQDVPAPEKLDVVGSGGSITTLADMSRRRRGGKQTISDGDLRTLEELCLSLTVAGRKRIPGLPPDRADIIPAGIAVVRGLLRLVRKRVLTINAGGVREGALIHLAENQLKW